MLARTLLAHDLIDEMRLMIDPIMVGRGKPAAQVVGHVVPV